MEPNRDYLEVLRKVHNNPNTNQRDLAKNLGFSLGKFNYLLNALKKKGVIKYKNFKKNQNKINYIYYLTPKGFTQKTKLTIQYLKRMSKEHEELKKEIKKKFKL
jgi:EPS-associated MarR family transcriptional regulator